MDETMKLLMGCKNVKVLGMWHDPEGVYPPMPIFELTEPSVEELNRRAEEQRRKYGITEEQIKEWDKLRDI